MAIRVNGFRRLLQVRLATLLVVCTLSAAGLGWLSAERRESDRQLQVAQRIGEGTEGGGEAEIVFGGPLDQLNVMDQVWWRRLARKVLGTRVVEMRLTTDSRDLYVQVGELSDLLSLRLDVNEQLTNDLTPLSRLTKLKELEIWQTVQAADLSPLSALRDLKRLDLSLAENVDLSPLGKLSELEACHLEFSGDAGNAGWVDIRPLAGLKQLQDLSIGGPVYDLSPLGDLDELESLVLQRIEDDSLAPLVKARRLAFLNIESSPVFDLSPLTGLSELEYLTVSDTAVVDLTPIRGLTKLMRLDISHTAISDLAPILGLSNLKELQASGIMADAAEWDRVSQALPNCKVVR